MVYLYMIGEAIESIAIKIFGETFWKEYGLIIFTVLIFLGLTWKLTNYMIVPLFIMVKSIILDIILFPFYIANSILKKIRIKEALKQWWMKNSHIHNEFIDILDYFPVKIGLSVDLLIVIFFIIIDIEEKYGIDILPFI